MQPHLEPQALMIAFQDGQVRAAVAGFTASDWTRRVGTANHAHWLIGHLAACRRETVRLLGAALPVAGWEARCYEKCVDGSDEPAAAFLVDDLIAVGDVLGATLRAFTAAAAQAPRDPAWWPGAKTIEGLAMYRFWHETYHVGQLAMIRRELGKPA